LAFRSGDSTALRLEDIKREDVATITRLGFLAPWGVK